jgi:hypothetical protein
LLEIVTFEANSALREIGESAFGGSRLKSIVIPATVEVMGKGAFWACHSLETATFEANTALREIAVPQMEILDNFCKFGDRPNAACQTRRVADLNGQKRSTRRLTVSDDQTRRYF